MKLLDLALGFSWMVLGGLGFAACGSSTSLSACPGGPDCACTTDTQCGCVEGGACSFACTGGDCKIDCGPGATCEGSCEKDCAASCPEGSTCTIDLGQDGDILCENADCVIAAGPDADVTCSGGTCEVTCESKCDVACKGGATCTVQCADDSEPKPIAEAGKCE